MTTIGEIPLPVLATTRYTLVAQLQYPLLTATRGNVGRWGLAWTPLSPLMTPRILAIDQGTTGTTAFLFDDKLRVKAHADREFKQHYPEPGRVEHDAEEIWRVTQSVVKKAVGKTKVDAIGITNQRETVVAWDAKTGKPLQRAIVWQDRRTAARCGQLKLEGLEPTFRDRTGLVLDPYFSATKMEWMLRESPKVQAAAKAGRLRFGTMDSWIIHKLTDGAAFVTDHSNASRTLLYDLDKKDWNDDLLSIFGVPRETLPTIVPSAGILAQTPDGVPISGVAGDQQAALFGQGCFAPGEAKCTYGTGSFLLMNTGQKRPSSKRLLATVAWNLGGKNEYALEGSVFTTGASVQWLRDGLQIIDTAAQTEKLAKSVKDSGGVRYLPALAGLGAPHWDPHARGALVGLTRGTTRAHVVRAVLEATAHRTTEVAHAMEEDSLVHVKTLRVDGGGSMNGFLMQLQADLLGVTVERPRISETTALGAASLAGLGAGIFANRGDVKKAWKLDKRWTPNTEKDARVERARAWREFVEKARSLYQ